MGCNVCMQGVRECVLRLMYHGWEKGGHAGFRLRGWWIDWGGLVKVAAFFCPGLVIVWRRQARGAVLG